MQKQIICNFDIAYSGGQLDSSAKKGSTTNLSKNELRDNNSPAKKLMKKLIQAKRNMENYQAPKLP